jgi:chromosomal replication initiation ATPase DnaA
MSNPFADVYGGMILGKDNFIKEMLGQLESGVFERTEVSHRKALNASIDVESILERICEHCNCRRTDLETGSNRNVRKMAVYILRKYTSLGNFEIGKMLGGLSYSGVSKSFHRVSELLRTDKELRKNVERLVAKVSNVKG